MCCVQGGVWCVNVGGMFSVQRGRLYEVMLGNTRWCGGLYCGVAWWRGQFLKVVLDRVLSILERGSGKCVQCPEVKQGRLFNIKGWGDVLEAWE